MFRVEALTLNQVLYTLTFYSGKVFLKFSVLVLNSLQNYQIPIDCLRLLNYSEQQDQLRQSFQYSLIYSTKLEHPFHHFLMQ
jgi:hypothetical protein